MTRALITSYFTACAEGTAEAITSHFTPDAVIYDLNVPPVRGATTIATFWLRIRDKWQGARWYVDSYVGAGEHAAIEWTMTGRMNPDSTPFAVRGSEHYRFASADDGALRIAEIRQYWLFDPRTMQSALRDYAYPLRDEGAA